MAYKTLIAQERTKLEMLRAKHAFLEAQIENSQQFIAMLEKRGDDGGDELDQFLEQQLAAKSAQPATPVVPNPAPPPSVEAPPPAPVSSGAQLAFPKPRADSHWPYVLRLMTKKDRTSASEINDFAINTKLVNSESAIRSTMASLKVWRLVTSDRPGSYSLSARGRAYLSTLTDAEFSLPGGAAGTAHSENNV